MDITNQIINELKPIADKYDVKLSYHEDCSDNNGMSGGDDIYLGKINNYRIGLLIFFHELSHILIERKMRDYGMEYHISSTVNEGAAWTDAIFLMRKNGYKVSTLYDSLEYKYIRKSISTYFENDINEVIRENFDTFELRSKLKIDSYWDRMVQLLKYINIRYDEICIDTSSNNIIIVIPLLIENSEKVTNEIDNFYTNIEKDIEGDSNKFLIIKSLEYNIVRKGKYDLLYFYKFEVDDEMLDGYDISNINTMKF